MHGDTGRPVHLYYTDRHIYVYFRMKSKYLKEENFDHTHYLSMSHLFRLFLGKYTVMTLTTDIKKKKKHLFSKFVM